MLGHSSSLEAVAPFKGSTIDRGLVPVNYFSTKQHLNSSTLSGIRDPSGEGMIMMMEHDRDSILEKIARKNLDRPKKLALAMSLSQPKRITRRRDDCAEFSPPTVEKPAATMELQPELSEVAGS